MCTLDSRFDWFWSLLKMFQIIDSKKCPFVASYEINSIINFFWGFKYSKKTIWVLFIELYLFLKTQISKEMLTNLPISFVFYRWSICHWDRRTSHQRCGLQWCWNVHLSSQSSRNWKSGGERHQIGGTYYIQTLMKINC